MSETISLRAARRLALARAGLLAPSLSGLPASAGRGEAAARRAAHAVIGRFGYLQLDTVSVAGSAQPRHRAAVAARAASRRGSPRSCCSRASRCSSTGATRRAGSRSSSIRRSASAARSSASTPGGATCSASTASSPTSCCGASRPRGRCARSTWRAKGGGGWWQLKIDEEGGDCAVVGGRAGHPRAARLPAHLRPHRAGHPRALAARDARPRRRRCAGCSSSRSAVTAGRRPALSPRPGACATSATRSRRRCASSSRSARSSPARSLVTVATRGM